MLQYRTSKRPVEAPRHPDLTASWELMRYTEMQMTSELLDRPMFSGVPKKLFICSTPRSGSYLLCRLMINAGLGVPHEYFNPLVMRDIAQRLGLAAAVKGLKWRRRMPTDYLPFRRSARKAEEAFLENYLAAVVPRRCEHGVFAAKIHLEHYTKVLDNPTGREFLTGGVFVHLYREHLLSQAISMNIARATGRWGIDNTVTTPPVTNLDLTDTSTLDSTVTELALEDMEWRLFLTRNGISAISVSYEQVCQDPFGLIYALAPRLGVDPGSLRRGYSESPEPIQWNPTLPDKDEIASKYLQIMQKVQSVPAIRPARPVDFATASEAAADA